MVFVVLALVLVVFMLALATVVVLSGADDRPGRTSRVRSGRVG